MIDKPGIYEMPMEQYQKDPVVSPSLSSGIAHRLVTQSPLHAWFNHPRLNPRHKSEEAKEFDLGSCAHSLLFEGEGNLVEINFPDWRKKEAQQQRDEARAMGKIPVLAHKLAECRSMAAAARVALEDIAEVKIDLSTGLAERVFVWQEGKAWCRSRPDWHSSDRTIYLDYKTTAGSAEPNAWMRNQMAPMGYDMQAIHYLRGNSRTGGPEWAQWIFMVQENYPPYAHSFVGLAPAMKEIAQRKWDFALAAWQHCTQHNTWKGYPNVVEYAEPTAWQMNDDEERRMLFDEMLELATA